jgi:hypothetical protein
MAMGNPPPMDNKIHGKLICKLGIFHGNILLPEGDEI